MLGRRLDPPKQKSLQIWIDSQEMQMEPEPIPPEALEILNDRPTGHLATIRPNGLDGLRLELIQMPGDLKQLPGEPI
jgi:hypothetical protein